MRVLVIHDKTGNIHGVVTSPPDAPPIDVEPENDEEVVTELDLEAAGLDVGDSVRGHELLERLREHRIDLTEGKLVPKAGH